MSRYFIIRGNMPIEDIIEKAQENKNGCLFHCNNSQIRNQMLHQINRGEYKFIFKEKEQLDPRAFVKFDPHMACSILIRSIK